jgi:sugar/nucleoside kinase (ribokinase family)
MPKTTPTVYGTGLVALDAIFGLNSKVPRLHAGGTCGNILTCLAFLGWKAFPISRLDLDGPGETVRADMRRWGVSVDHLGLQPAAPTPVIVEQIVKTKTGVVKHRFQFNCPQCGGFFPSFRPLREDTAREFTKSAPSASVFFTDRVSPGILILAEYFRSAGALIVFEPSGTGNENHFKRMLELADIVKYSHDRAASFVDVLQSAAPVLQIETLGAAGIQYCSRTKTRRRQSWRQLHAFTVTNVRDSSGSGDWTTAGLIDRLAAKGRDAFLKMKDAQLEEALRYAQSIAAWNCGFEGPRGGMYEQTRDEFEHRVNRILQSTDDFEVSPMELSFAGEVAVCSDCHAFVGKPVARASEDVLSTESTAKRRRAK